MKHRAHVNGKEFAIPSPTVTKTFPAQQPTMEVTNPVDLASFGPTTRAPIGYVCHGRSGDKSSNVNIGLYVRNADEWDWLRTFLTTDKMKELLRDEYTGMYRRCHVTSSVCTTCTNLLCCCCRKQNRSLRVPGRFGGAFYLTRPSRQGCEF